MCVGGGGVGVCMYLFMWGGGVFIVMCVYLFNNAHNIHTYLIIPAFKYIKIYILLTNILNCKTFPNKTNRTISTPKEHVDDTKQNKMHSGLN